MTCGVYILTRRDGGRSYVGQSRNIEERWKQHARAREPFAIGRAIAKHGWAAFDARVLEVCAESELNECEQKWIAAMGTLSPAGYNLRTGGGQAARFSSDVIDRIRSATKAALTPERIAASAEKRRGIPKPPEWKAMMSKRQSLPDNVERLRAMASSQTAETRAKISASKKGRVVSKETRAKISAAAKSENRAARMRESPSYMSPEARAKMSAAAKARCARKAAAVGTAP